jgi:tripartite-type tricarboxylate transporter receptor subunit TctC
MSRRSLLLPLASLAAAMMLAGLGVAPAAGFPDRPIHLLVPYPPGGPNDVIARLIANKLDDKFSQQVVVDNRPGGNGDIALADTARAAPDGYTIVLPAMAYAVNLSLFADAGYSFDQFAPVSIVTEGPLILVVHPSLGVKSVKELIALAKSEPGKINYGSGGNGSSLHLAAELFKSEAKIDLQHIPYKGTNDMIADLLTGRVSLAFISPLVAKPYVARGDLMALAITSAERSPGWPDTPTIAEAGVPGYAMAAWYAVLAPKGTPQNVVDTLNGAIAEAVKSPEVSAKLQSLGNVPVGGSAAEAAATIAQEAKRWHDIIATAGIKPE